MSRSLRVAVADDEPISREYFWAILPLLGHEVVAVAATRRQLVEGCAQSCPDLVITDIQMPEMDGIEAAARIYQDRPVPVILVTGHAGPEYLERAEAAQVMAYLLKPVTREALEPAILLAVSRFEQLLSSQKEAAELLLTLTDATIPSASRAH